MCDDNNVYFDRAAAAAVVQIYNDDDKGGYRYGPPFSLYIIIDIYIGYGKERITGRI
jgi:hypothetical protein